MICTDRYCLNKHKPTLLRQKVEKVSVFCTKGHCAIKYSSCLKQPISQACLLHDTDITEEISSFGGTINSSLQQLCTGLCLGQAAGFILSASPLYLICLSSSCNAHKPPLLKNTSTSSSEQLTFLRVEF